MSEQKNSANQVLYTSNGTTTMSPAADNTAGDDGAGAPGTTASIPLAIEPEVVVLKDQCTYATLHPIYSNDKIPDGLLQFLTEEFNAEIDRGDTYPHMERMTPEQFRQYWFGSFGAVFLIGTDQQLPQDIKWEEKVLGSFYIKPNFPGRSSHVCNAGFVVNEYIRGKGVGMAMAKLYMDWAPKLGYTYSMFNLVFETNTASIRIWDQLGFSRIGTIKGAGMLKGYKKPVDAFIYGKHF